MTIQRVDRLVLRVLAVLEEHLVRDEHGCSLDWTVVGDAQKIAIFAGHGCAVAVFATDTLLTLDLWDNAERIGFLDGVFLGLQVCGRRTSAPPELR